VTSRPTWQRHDSPRLAASVRSRNGSVRAWVTIAGRRGANDRPPRQTASTANDNIGRAGARDDVINLTIGGGDGGAGKRTPFRQAAATTLLIGGHRQCGDHGIVAVNDRCAARRPGATTRYLESGADGSGRGRGRSRNRHSLGVQMAPKSARPSTISARAAMCGAPRRRRHPRCDLDRVSSTSSSRRLEAMTKYTAATHRPTV